MACVIPAYNEGERIRRVLSTIRQVTLLSRIIIVDDGSSDTTAEEARAAAGGDGRVRVLRHEKNRGKGAAMMTGVAALGTPGAILFLDADLAGLVPQHLVDLVEPVLRGQAEMTIGLFRGGHWTTDLSHRLTPWLSGQRCVRADLVHLLDWHAAEGYGFETAWTLAAMQRGWRVRPVTLHGVRHPPSESHRGLWRGVLTRVRMYAQIVRAWFRAGGPGLVLPRLSLRTRRALIFLGSLVLIGGTSLVYNYSQDSAGLKLNQLAPLPVAGVHRLLIVAPHPDDETLGAGGLIQQALAHGAEVRVLVMTNGDGQEIAPLILDQRIRASPAEYIAIGKLRQDESAKGLAALGLPASQVVFLGYPDRGLDKMWSGDWQQGCPYRSAYTRATRSPYPLTFDASSEYCGKDVIADVLSLLREYRPDAIVVPHPNDDHPDHRATANFVLMAVDLLSAEDATYQPAVWGYLVHYGFYPEPRGFRPAAALVPPRPLVGTADQWLRLQLSPSEEDTKATAVRAYASQDRLMGEFLPSFARTDEVFADLPVLALEPVQWSLFTVGEPSADELPTSPGSSPQALAPGAELAGWQLARVGDTLWITAQTRGHLLPGAGYRILVKTPAGRTLVFHATAADVLQRRASFTAELDLAQLGHPSVLGFAAQVREEIVLGRTAWHFVLLRSQW